MPQVAPAPTPPFKAPPGTNYPLAVGLNVHFLKTCGTKDYRPHGLIPNIAYDVLDAIRAGHTLTFVDGSQGMHDHGDVICPDGAVYEWCITCRMRNDERRRSEFIDDVNITRRLLNVWAKGARPPLDP